MDQSIERWLPVVGYEGFYEVSDHGRVRSVKRQVWVEESSRSYWRRYRQRVLAPAVNRGGYAVVGLAAKGGRITKTIHGLVLRAFVGPCPDGMEGRHKDGHPSNNHLSNLSWATRSVNYRDRLTHGTHNNGASNGRYCHGRRVGESGYVAPNPDQASAMIAHPVPGPSACQRGSVQFLSL